MNFEIENSDGSVNGLFVFLLIVVGISVLIGIFAFFASFGTVNTGSRGVVLRLQNPTGEIKEQGFYWKTPFLEDVIDMPVQILKEEAEATAASKDLQDVTTKIALNYHLDPLRVGNIYQEVRKDYTIRIIQPAIQEAVKSATAKYTAEELITKRSEVRDAIVANIREKITPRGMLVDEVNIINFAFSGSFNAAIEKKVTAEQEALASKNQLEKVKYDAQQSIERAKGEAESIRIQSQALTEQPQYLEKLAIEKWSGILPQYITDGTSMPFINVK